LLFKTKNFQNHHESQETEVTHDRDIIFITNVLSPTIETFLPSNKRANGLAIKYDKIFQPYLTKLIAVLLRLTVQRTFLLAVSMWNNQTTN